MTKKTVAARPDSEPSRLNDLRTMPLDDPEAVRAFCKRVLAVLDEMVAELDALKAEAAALRQS